MSVIHQQARQNEDLIACACDDETQVLNKKPYEQSVVLLFFLLLHLLIPMVLMLVLRML